jgi:hypothetical protein
MESSIPPDANDDPNRRTPEEQEEWERFVRSLPGSISSEDLELMSRAIEEGCGQIDPKGWEVQL